MAVDRARWAASTDGLRATARALLTELLHDAHHTTGEVCGTTITAWAEHLQVSRNTVSADLAELERRELVAVALAKRGHAGTITVNLAKLVAPVLLARAQERERLKALASARAQERERLALTSASDLGFRAPYACTREEHHQEAPDAEAEAPADPDERGGGGVDRGRVVEAALEALLAAEEAAEPPGRIRTVGAWRTSTRRRLAAEHLAALERRAEALPADVDPDEAAAILANEVRAAAAPPDARQRTLNLAGLEAVADLHQPAPSAVYAAEDARRRHPCPACHGSRWANPDAPAPGAYCQPCAGTGIDPDAPDLADEPLELVAFASA